MKEQVQKLFLLYCVSLIIVCVNQVNAIVLACSRPADGCSSLNSYNECSQWSGCNFQANICVDQFCDQLNCGLREVTIRFATRILPGCVRRDQTQCNSEVDLVTNALGLNNQCAVKTSYHINVSQQGRRLQDPESTVEPTSSPSTTAPSKSPSTSPSKSPSTTAPSKSPSTSPSKSPSTTAPSKSPSTTAPSKSPTESPDVVLYIDPLGSDSNSGKDRLFPLRTIPAGLARLRARRDATSKTLKLVRGKHRITQTIVLTSADSNVRFEGETGAILTGAISLEVLKWTAENNGVYSTVIPDQLLPLLGPLSVLSHREESTVRARFPDKSTVTETRFSARGVRQWFNAVSAPSTYSVQSSPVLGAGTTRYKNYISAFGGRCQNVFTPSGGYFCSPSADADAKCPYAIPNRVYMASDYSNAMNLYNWKERETGYFHALHPLKWGGWTFKIAPSGGTSRRGLKRAKPTPFPTTKAPSTSPTVTNEYEEYEFADGRSSLQNIAFESGGFQEARGDCKKGGGEWYIENIRELLNAQNEFFVDLTASKIFFIPRPDQRMDSTLFQIGRKITRLISAEGSSSSVIRNLYFKNIIFERTYPTHMEPHEMTSGGDWTVHRGGALYLQGVDTVTVEDCTFRNLGSNGLFVSHYARNVVIQRNTFFNVDGSGILLVGDSKLTSSQPWDRRGDGDHIEKVVVRNNLIYDIGLMEIQAGGIFGSITKDITIERNTIFNGPRAAIVYNDLYGGSHVTRHNIAFNMVRLTLDHGPYNVWDRQQWLLPPNFASQPNYVNENIFIGSSSAEKVIDLDDGARDHVILNNVVGYGYIKFKGSNHRAENNLVLAFAPSQKFCVKFCGAQTTPARYVYSKNTCFAGTGRAAYGWEPQDKNRCKSPELITSQNTFYSARADYGVCGTAAVWRSKNGQDVGSYYDPSLPSQGSMVSSVERLVQTYALP